MNVRPIRLCIVALAVLATPLHAGEFQAATAAIRASYDVGSLSVPDTDRGIGGGVALRAGFGDRHVSWEVGAELDVAGYTGAGDGDPIFTLAATIHRRASLSEGAAFWRAGAGIGFLGLGADAVALPLTVGLGVDLAPRSSVGVELVAFERLTLAFSQGDPSTDFINGLGVELALRFGKRR